MDDTLDIYSKLKKFISVLVDLVEIFEKSWYLCKEILWYYWEVMCEIYECEVLYHMQKRIFDNLILWFEIELKLEISWKKVQHLYFCIQGT